LIRRGKTSFHPPFYGKTSPREKKKEITPDSFIFFFEVEEKAK